MPLYHKMSVIVCAYPRILVNTILLCSGLKKIYPQHPALIHNNINDRTNEARRSAIIN